MSAILDSNTEAHVEDSSFDFSTHPVELRDVRDPRNTPVWEEFCRRYTQYLKNVAPSVGCKPWLVEDIVQNCMIELVKIMPTFTYDPQKGRFRSYLKTMLRRRVIDLQRKEYRRIALLPPTHWPDGELPEISDNMTPEDFAANTLLKKYVEDVLAGLPVKEDTREAFRQMVLDELSGPEVAEELQVELNAVHQKVNRVRKMFKQKLERGEFHR